MQCARGLSKLFYRGEGALVSRSIVTPPPFKTICFPQRASTRSFCSLSSPRCSHRPRPHVSRAQHLTWRGGRSVSESAFDRSQKRSVKFEQLQRSLRYQCFHPLQPISWTSLAVLVVGGGIAVIYVKHLKALKEKGTCL